MTSPDVSGRESLRTKIVVWTLVQFLQYVYTYMYVCIWARNLLSMSDLVWFYYQGNVYTDTYGYV